MQHAIPMHDFECFTFFQNVIQSKLKEAQQHLQKLEMYKISPDLFNAHRLDEMIHIHEEDNDFIAIVYTQCRMWRTGSLNINQLANVLDLEKMTNRLESTIYHVLFVIEQFQKLNDRAQRCEHSNEPCESVTKH